LHNEEFNDLYSSPNIVRMMKSRRVKWAGHVARMGTGEVHTEFWLGDIRDGDSLEVPVVGERIF
jgi:hypothetical protein